MDRYSLKTEIMAVGSVKKMTDLLMEIAEGSSFVLEPLPIYRRYTPHQSFYVMLIDPETRQKICCGSVELMRRKDHGVVVKLDSSRCSQESLDKQSSSSNVPMERFFYMVVQRLVQQDLLVKKH